MGKKKKERKTFTSYVRKRASGQVPWTEFQMSPLAEDEEHVRINGVPWFNSRWQVWIREDVPTGFPNPDNPEKRMLVTHLSIKRHDRDVLLGKDWRDFQRIKNELCGTDCEAVEIYPAEQRLVDTANQYHLWVFPPGLTFPVGYTERLVAEETRDKSRQRAFEDDAKPEDLKTSEELEKMGRDAGIIT